MSEVQFIELSRIGWPFTKNVELHLISPSFAKATAGHGRPSASLAPSFALRASEGHSRRGAFTLSLSNVPTRRADVYPEPSFALVLGLFFCARDFLALRASEEEIYSFPCPAHPCAENDFIPQKYQTKKRLPKMMEND